MLARLCINNITIVERLEVVLKSGMTVITGETGAGKSIIVDALALALGGRADTKVVRPHCSRADISATFDISNMQSVRDWLCERGLDNNDGECVLQRIVSVDGRSRACVNGRNMPVREVQTIGRQLVSICGQRAHYALLDSSTQRNLLDHYGELQETSETVRTIAEKWQQLRRQLDVLGQGGSSEQQCELLRYQISDIEALKFDVSHFNDMEEEYQRRSAADELLGWCQQTQQLNNNEDGSNARLREAVHLMECALAKDERLQEAYEHLYSALQHSDDAARALDRYSDDFDLDPRRLQELTTQLNEINRIADSHKTEPRELNAVLARLKKELEFLEKNMGLLEDGDQQLESLQQQYAQHANTLSEKRAESASRMCSQVNENLRALEMSHCQFEVALSPHNHAEPRTSGQEGIKFMVSTNPGHPAGPLDKVASGGELSRISLALQVATLGTSAPPCLVFDEVDSGVSSHIAHQVGKLLANLGKRGQVLCITHLAPVAGCAQQHWVADKEVHQQQTVAKLRELYNTEERVEEMARIISGHNITDQARAHARELLQT